MASVLDPTTGAATAGSSGAATGYSSVVSIEELAADRSVVRSVELRGPGLPLMGADWASELNMDTTWYPGNPEEATQQVFGRRELPSAWNGTWSLTQMSRAPSLFYDGGAVSQITSPKFLHDLLDDIFGNGHRLRVTWTVESDSRALAGRIVREGRAKNFKGSFKRMVDIDWSVEFHWVSRGASVQKVTSTRDDNLPSAQAALAAALALTIAAAEGTAIYNSKKGVRLSANTFTLGQLETLAGAPKALMEKLANNLRRINTQMQQVVGIANTIRNLPYAVANTAVGMARTVVENVNQDVDTFSRTPVEKLALRATVSDVLRAASHFAQAQDAAELAARRAQELDAKMRSQLSTNPGRGQASVRSSSTTRAGEIIAVHVCKTGDTPESLSMRYYGNPDRSIEILRANRLPWHQVTFNPATILIIPVVPSTQGA